MNKLQKLLKIAASPAYWPAFAQGIAPSLEHVTALSDLKIGFCIDVGANKGQFSLLCRSLFPEAKIVAFEPFAPAADMFTRLFGSSVELHRIALGSADATSRFHVTRKSDSSSLLAPGAAQVELYGSEVTEVLDVTVRRLDDILRADQVQRPSLLKIDVQGGEIEVLRGCGQLLDVIDYIYLEGAFVELYDGQILIGDIIDLLADHDFRLRGVFNVDYTSRFGATQADFLFCRSAVRDLQLKLLRRSASG